MVRQEPGRTSPASYSACSLTMPHLPVLTTGTALRAIGRVLRKLGRRAGVLARGGPQWAVALRFDPSSSLLAKRAATFAPLATDGRRYYADPFPFQHEGQTYLFMEEFPYATGRGCISVTKIDATGCVTAPRPVLEEPYHLSYPFVFKHANDIWMIPESSEARAVHLYRAERFPDHWQREACLVDGISA